MKKLLLGIALILAIACAPVRAQTCAAGSNASLQITYTIVAPTTNADGTPLTLPVTFNLYTASVITGQPAPTASSYVKSASGITPTSAGQAVVVVSSGVTPGVTYYAEATAQDVNGEGAPSAVACKSFPQDATPPNKPALSNS